MSQKVGSSSEDSNLGAQNRGAQNRGAPFLASFARSGIGSRRIFAASRSTQRARNWASEKGKTELLFPLLWAHPYAIANSAEEACWPRNQSLAIAARARTPLRQATQNLVARNARSDLIHRGKLHRAVGRQNKYSRLGNATLFVRTIDTPLPHHAASRVRQNGKRKPQVPPYGLGFLGSIYGNGHHVRARSTQFWVKVAIFRQLAETERSPVPAVEQKNQRSGRSQFGKASLLARGVRKLELGRRLPHLRRHP